MKRIKLFNWVLVSLITLLFSACDNEPLVGEFLQPDDPAVAEEGQFKCQIDGVEFIATLTEAVLTTDNLLVISGIIDTTGETVSLTAEEAAVGTFNLIAGDGTENVAKYFNTGTTADPYTSSGNLGGSGQLIITDLNMDDLTISGTFSFIGKRVQLDANGDPVLDGNGDEIIEEVTVSPGAFNTIAFIIDDTGGGGGGGGGGGNDPVSEFFALVDGVEFVDTMITTTVPTVGGIEMVNIVAQTDTGAWMRIDLPLLLGEGTFMMEALSDGTQVIAVYNDNTGGENLTSNPGTITINQFNTEEGIIEATFNFTGSDPLLQDPTIVEVTEGSFTVYFEGIAGSGPSPFIADVDGEVYDPETINIVPSILGGIETVSIVTNKPDGQNLSLTFPKEIEVGTYDMSSLVIDGNDKIGTYNPDIVGGTTTYSSNPGTLTIISYDILTGDIEGTFEFTATDPLLVDPTEYEITNGSFALNIL